MQFALHNSINTFSYSAKYFVYCWKGCEIMKTINLDKAMKPLSEYANEIDDEILILKSKNKPVAAIVSLKKVDFESLALSTNSEFLEIIEKSQLCPVSLLHCKKG